ncbi:MAG: hypothetical protein ACI9T9_000522 [Oleiphilaceae bacterium]|jgi:hypothetical protein
MSASDKYVITQETIGNRIEIEIDDIQFCALFNAKQTLSAAFSLEEKYELLLMNFLELEKEVLNNTAEYSLFDAREYSEFFDIRVKMNQRVVNFLTSCRLYVDHAKSHIKTCLSQSIFIKDDEDSLFNEEFDQYFEYRFCEKLRNHVQHQSLAVHTVSQGGQWHGEHRVETTRIYTLKNQLVEGKSFSKKFLCEVPDKVELISVFKKYIELLSNVHSKIRFLIKEYVEISRSEIESHISQYALQNNGDAIGLAAIHYKVDENGRLDKHKIVPLFLDWDDVRIKLECKNSKLVKFSYRKIESVNEMPDVLQNQIRAVAEAVRKVIQSIPIDDRYPGLKRFPSGACGDASVILGQYLIETLNIDLDYYSGSLIGEAILTSHAWLQNDEFIVDITADQFDGIDIKTWVTINSNWHKRFNGKLCIKRNLNIMTREH